MNRKRAAELSKAFGLEVVQSRYSDWGNFYGLVQAFPCALWDRSGYVVFEDGSELEISEISVGKRINVPKGISSLSTYKLVFNDTQLPEELPDGIKYQEGTVQQIKVNRYERDKQARDACLAHYGYVCQICGVRLGEIYGDVAKKLIHVHHLKPISEIGKSYSVDPVSDLIPACPNCHSVIHLRIPPYTPQEVAAMLYREHEPYVNK